MISDPAVCENYVFCVEKSYKDGFYYEAKARDIVSGKFYDVRFDSKKKFAFFIYDLKKWNVYLFCSDAVYHPSAFCDVCDLESLENDVKDKKAIPLVHIKSGRVRSCFLRKGGRIELPELPFFYPSELGKLDVQTEKERYNYAEAPKYLITARLSKYVKAGATPSQYVFGCNSDELYRKIRCGSSVAVTDTNKNLKAVVVKKAKNTFGVIPKQHCLRMI